MAVSVCRPARTMEENLMSLLNDAMTACTMLDKRTASDERGSMIPTWTEGAEFQAAITFDTSMEARRAEAQGVVSLYTVTTTRAINLQYHDVFRREEDGKIFRVTSDGDDKKTPESAGLNMRQVSAESWSLPVEE